MGEFAASETGNYRLGAAGDSFNTAVYLARRGLPVEYLTCLGDDDISAMILDRMGEEGIGRERIRILPGRQAGIYMIRNDPDGERHFTYWRGQSAARALFEERPRVSGIANFYFTGITLAVTRDGVDNLLELLAGLRSEACGILFDPNYRPALWDDPRQARELTQRVLPLCDAVYPTLEDERVLWGIEDADQCRDFYMDMGVTEVVVKAPDLTACAWHRSARAERRAARLEPLDTSGAGDAFNAGYLAVRLRGGDLDAALEAAQDLSSRVVRHRGAILPREHDIPRR
jgi:2-dehydro-3-deoxygluconokinase